MDKKYRHEWKHRLSTSDMIAIRQRMRAVARPDPHAKDGAYIIRSLYFDTPSDKALLEKINGVDMREKFRIRFYDLDTSVIHLEKKSKKSGLGTKYSASLTKEEAQKIVDGDIDWMIGSSQPLVNELYLKMRYQLLAPKTIVEYVREPFIYDAGNVRVTLDYNLRTGLCSTDFLSEDAVMIPAADSPILMEVKWDEFLPGIIRDAVQLPFCRSEAFSKYASCRLYD